MQASVVAAARQHPNAAVRYMAMRWPEEFRGTQDMAPVGPSPVQERMMIIPAERVLEFARSMATADLEPTSDPDPLSTLRLIEE